jgi:predicted permease
VLLPIVVVVGIGYLLKRFLPIDTRPLNRISMYALSPAVDFYYDCQNSNPWYRGTTDFVDLGGGLFGFGASGLSDCPLAQMSGSTGAGLLLVTMFMNSGNYGLPTARFAFGQPGFERALLFIAQAIMAQTLTIAIAQAGKSDWKAGIRQVLRMPPIYAVTTGLLLRALGVQFDTPNALGSVLHGVDLVSRPPCRCC